MISMSSPLEHNAVSFSTNLKGARPLTIGDGESLCRFFHRLAHSVKEFTRNSQVEEIAVKFTAAVDRTLCFDELAPIASQE
jgi:hypothetical protein